MALSLDYSGTIRVIPFQDPSIDVDRETYEKYLVDLDEGILNFVEDAGEPTRFVLKKQIPYKYQQQAQERQVKIVAGQPEINVSFMDIEIRAALTDIENPGSKTLEFKKDGADQLCQWDLFGLLKTAGIIPDLYFARKNALEKKGSAPAKKNS